MTPKQKAFAEFYAQSGNGSESVRRAGYASDNADVEAARLLANPSIQDYLSTLTQDATDNRIADAIERQIFWTDVMRNKEEKTEIRLKSSELLARSQGQFLDKVQHSGGLVQMPVTIEIVGV